MEYGDKLEKRDGDCENGNCTALIAYGNPYYIVQGKKLCPDCYESYLIKNGLTSSVIFTDGFR